MEEDNKTATAGRMLLDDDLLVVAMEFIDDELETAVVKFPEWPVHMFEGFGILQEEVGEIVQAMNNMHWSDTADLNDVIKETAQAGAMCLRFIQYLLMLQGGEVGNAKP